LAISLSYITLTLGCPWQEGVTALHTAVQHGHGEVVRALLAGAARCAAVRADAPRGDGVTALALAAQVRGLWPGATHSARGLVWAGGGWEAGVKCAH
jgi:hypothetical protein